MSSLHFNSLLLDISDELTPDQLDSLKFLCADIGKRDLEKCTTGHKLFQILMQRGQLGPDNTDNLHRLLTELKRPDLCAKLPRCAGEGPLPHRDHVAEVLSESLGRHWRKLGRKLGLSEVRLESIAMKHPTDLEETAVELLQEWRRSQGEQATVEVLVQALRACQLNLTAEALQDSL